MLLKKHTTTVVIRKEPMWQEESSIKETLFKIMAGGLASMALITNILFPVDARFPALPWLLCQRAASRFGARVSLIYVVDPTGYNGFDHYARLPFEIEEDHRAIGR